MLRDQTIERCELRAVVGETELLAGVAPPGQHEDPRLSGRVEGEFVVVNVVGGDGAVWAVPQLPVDPDRYVAARRCSDRLTARSDGLEDNVDGDWLAGVSP